MKLDYRHLALVLVVASGFSGCKGLWNDFFGSSGTTQELDGKVPGGTEECKPPRDEHIASKLANNYPCSDDSTCPLGAFCTGNGVSGTCIRECGLGLPNCTGNRYCSCKGVCEDVTPGGVDGGGSAVPVACARVPAVLDQITADGGERRCESDSICPLGAYCNLATGYCAWDCRTDSDCTGGTGTTCDCYGRCISADGGVALMRREFAMSVSPISINVVPLKGGDGGVDDTWQRTLDITLTTRDQTLLPGADIIQPRLYGGALTVSVRQGAALQVSCDRQRSPIFTSAGCDLTNAAGDPWVFNWDADKWKATKTILLAPAKTPVGISPSLTGDEWTVRVHSVSASPNVVVATLNLEEGQVEGEWKQAQLTPGQQGSATVAHQGFRGTVSVSPALALGPSALSNASASVDVQVSASGLNYCTPMGGGDLCMTIYDPSGLIAGKPLVQIPFMDATGTRDPLGIDESESSTYLSFGGANDSPTKGGLIAILRGRRISLLSNTRTGALKGIFNLRIFPAGKPVDGTQIYTMQASIMLTPVIAGVSCADNSQCQDKKACWYGLCVPESVAPVEYKHNTEDPTDLRRANVDTAYSTLAQHLHPLTPWLGNPYHVSVGRYPIAVPRSGGPSPFSGRFDPEKPSAMWPPLMFPFQAEKAIQDGLMDITLRQAHFGHFLTGLVDNAPATKSLQTALFLNGGPCGTGNDESDIFNCLQWGLVTKGYNGYIPCLDENPYEGNGGFLSSAGSDWAASCQRLMSNVKTGGGDATFSDCVLQDQLVVAITPTWDKVDWHQVYLCPQWEHAVLWGQRVSNSQAQESAYRFLCANTSSPLTGAASSPGNYPEALSFSGDYRCVDSSGPDTRYFPPDGVSLLNQQDRTGTGDIMPAALLRTCLSDLKLAASVPPADESYWTEDALKRYLTKVYANNSCFSPGTFFSALRQLRDTTNPAFPLISDTAGQRLYLRLLQQWLEMHSFIATHGLEEYKLANTQAGRGAVTADKPGTLGDNEKAVPLDELMTTLEDGFALILDQASLSGSLHFNIHGEAVAAPDYRDLVTVGASNPALSRCAGRMMRRG